MDVASQQCFRFLVLGALLAAGVLLSAMRAGAGCIGNGTGLLALLEAQTFRNPRAALAEIRRIEAVNPDRLPATSRATLKAMAGEAYRQLDQVTPALEAANRGLALIAPERHSPIAIRLRLLRALMLDESNATAKALGEFDALVQEEAGNPLAIACARKDRGWIRDSTGDAASSLRDLIEAHRYFDANGPREEAMVAAGRLATLYRADGDFETSAKLIRETLDYFTTMGAWVRVATARDRLGNLFMDQGRYAEAMPEFVEERRLSLLADDVGGVAYAELWMCRVHLALKAYEHAMNSCLIAHQGLARIDAVYPADAAVIEELLGEIRLGLASPQEAADHFRASLATQATDLKGALGLALYRGLSDAEARLGHFQAAYLAGAQYAQRLESVHREQSSRQLALLRVQFEMDRQRAANSALLRDRAGLLQLNARAARERNVILLASGMTLACLASIFALILRHRNAEASRRAANQRVADLGRLCAAVAHDFNNLMTVIQQAAGMLARTPSVAEHEASSSLIEAISGAAGAGGDITRQLLAFGRQQDMQPELVPLGQFLAQQSALLRQAAANRATLQFLCIDPALTVWADPGQLTNALINLIVNAKDATSEGQSISIAARPSPCAAEVTRIEVTDTGCGMSPDTLSRCTEAFYSTKPLGFGSGLGLSAVLGFANQAGGTLRIESSVGHGTTVMLDLPAR